MQRRTNDRIKIIDHMIKTEYPEKGAEYIAESLGEEPGYILSRARTLRVKKAKADKPKKEKPLTKNQLIQRIENLKSQNKTLRLELIIATEKNRRIYG